MSRAKKKPRTYTTVDTISVGWKVTTTVALSGPQVHGVSIFLTYYIETGPAPDKTLFQSLL